MVSRNTNWLNGRWVWIALTSAVIAPFVLPSTSFALLLPYQQKSDEAKSDSNQNQGKDANEKPAANPDSNRPGVLVKIPLPVDAKTASRIKRSLKRIVEKAPQVVQPSQRQVVVLEFDTAGGKTGRGSELEACQSLARYLASPDMNRVETIAFIPTDPREPQSSSELNGHAVLIAISASQIAMANNASIGKAGIDESNVDGLVRAVYQGIASQRLTMPVPIVMSMLDKTAGLYRVRTDIGPVFATSVELEELEASGKAIETKTLASQDELAILDSQQLLDFRLIRNRVQTKAELARKLDLAPNALFADAANQEQWRAIEVDLPPYVDDRTTEWIIRSLSSQFARKDSPNLVLFKLEGNDGDIDACLNLSRYLADLDSDSVQTVGYMVESTKGPAALVALCCDQLVMTPESRLGGDWENADEAKRLSEEDLVDIKPMVKALARDKQKDWSLMMAMIDPNSEVIRFRNMTSGQVRLLSLEEQQALDRPDDWAALGDLGLSEGLKAPLAEQLYVARTVVEDFEQVKSFYQLDSYPTTLRPSATDRWVERVAMFLSSPPVSMFLLFMGMFFFSSEMSAPGLGVPGFMATVCFILFFWSQYLGGNAHWLEIILFLAGIVFVAMEIFVLPGFGIFGIGGLLMIVVSLVLASQDFIIPRTSAELARLPLSLLPVVGAGLGFFTAIFALRKLLPNSPYLKNMLLSPRNNQDETGLQSDHDPEAIVDWSYLLGSTGETITRLFPAGKARISGKVYDVITDGRMVDKGQKVEVIEAVGNRVVVVPSE